MSIANNCSFCKSDYIFNPEYYSKGKLTCSICAQVCEFYFLDEMIADSCNADSPSRSESQQLLYDKENTHNFRILGKGAKDSETCEIIEGNQLQSINMLDEDIHNGERSLSCDTLYDLVETKKVDDTKRIDEKTKEKIKPTLSKSFDKLEELSYILKLDKQIVEKSKENLRTVYEMHKFQGRTITSLVIATIFTTCRQCNTPRNFKEIVNKLHLSKEDKNNSMRSIMCIKNVIENSNENTLTTNILGLVRKYCSDLNLNQEILKTTLEATENICEKGLLEGRLPSTVAAACVFYTYSKFTKKATLRDVFLDQLVYVSNTYKNTITNALHHINKSYSDSKVQVPTKGKLIIDNKV